MRKFKYVYDIDLESLIKVLTDNGKRVEVHKTTGFMDGRWCQYYEVFILGDTEEE